MTSNQNKNNSLINSSEVIKNIINNSIFGHQNFSQFKLHIFSSIEEVLNNKKNYNYSEFEEYIENISYSLLDNLLSGHFKNFKNHSKDFIDFMYNNNIPINLVLRDESLLSVHMPKNIILDLDRRIIETEKSIFKSSSKEDLMAKNDKLLELIELKDSIIDYNHKQFESKNVKIESCLSYKLANHLFQEILNETEKSINNFIDMKGSDCTDILKSDIDDCLNNFKSKYLFFETIPDNVQILKDAEKITGKNLMSVAQNYFKENKFSSYLDLEIANVYLPMCSKETKIDVLDSTMKIFANDQSKLLSQLTTLLPEIDFKYIMENQFEKYKKMQNNIINKPVVRKMVLKKLNSDMKILKQPRNKIT